MEIEKYITQEVRDRATDYYLYCLQWTSEAAATEYTQRRFKLPKTQMNRVREQAQEYPDDPGSRNSG